VLRGSSGLTYLTILEGKVYLTILEDKVYLTILEGKLCKKKPRGRCG